MTTSKRKPVLDPITQRFLDSIAAQGGKPIYQMSYIDARNALESVQAGKARRAPADVEDRTLVTGALGEIPVSIYRPQGTRSALPAVMYFHGGGWVLGSKNTHDRLLRELTASTGAAFVFVNYTPAPDAQFPVQIEQAYAATKYVADHAGELSLDGSRLAVAGDSVGGAMATAIAMLAKERIGPSICHQALLYPVTDSSLSQASYDEFSEGFWLTSAAMKWFWDAYAPDLKDRKKAIASPLLASKEQLIGLPATLLLTAENDVLRNEGEEYARKLIEAGVEVSVVRVLATIHDFAMLNALAETPPVVSAIQFVSRKIAAALGLETIKGMAAA